MKHCLTILLLLLAIPVIAQEKAPKLVVEAFEYDFGKVKENTKASHTFTIKNEGTADVVIENVAPS
ncbi:MAG TPA: DUF1573 domain-containing protein [Blastocatellia bacterium]|nr:DUF1573 domain-containing protein [Blastocatellia bacterium]